MLAERTAQMEGQMEASTKHWAAESHMKGLEEKLLVMRLEEAEHKLRDASRLQRSAAEFAEECRSLRTFGAPFLFLRPLFGCIYHSTRPRW